MIISAIQGGLGNQLFQYSFGLYLSRLRQERLLLDLSWFKSDGKLKETKRQFELGELLTTFQEASIEDVESVIGSKYWLNFNRLLCKVNFCWDSSFCFERTPFHFQRIDKLVKENVYTEGYWQHWKYSEGLLGFLRSQLRLGPDASSYGDYPDSADTAVIHIRRGDYVGHAMHPVLPVDFYITALSLLEYKVGHLRNVIVFSDDINWCKENCKEFSRTREVSFVETGSVIEQFRLLSSYRYYVIANSTFSWWAAWLSDYSDKLIVAPALWINNDRFDAKQFFPPNWHVL